MTTRTKRLPCRSVGTVDHADARAAIHRLSAMAASYAEVTQGAGAARLDLGYASADLQATSSGLRIALSATDPGAIAALQALFDEQLRDRWEGSALALRWTAGPASSPRAYRRMTVLRTEDLTPHMRRITLTGAALEPFAENGLHVSLFFPGAGPLPQAMITADGRLSWSDAAEPTRRAYTLRSVDVAQGQVAIDMLLHATNGFAPGAEFAASARPGDVVGMAGPGGGMLPHSPWVLLGGDETALPAIARMLEGLPPEVVAVVRLEVGTAADETPLTSKATLDLRWLHRNGLPAESSPLLLDALRRVECPPAETERFVWFAAEAGIARVVKAWLRDEAGFAAAECVAANFWRA